MKKVSEKVMDVLGKKTQFILGDDATAYGAVLAGCRFFAGYPITPATEAAEIMSRLMPKLGGVYIQMEDEIGSIGAVIGASWTGEKAMTATSGPGFSLMQENIGYACMTETPCVVVNVQRGGPSTGQPTHSAQGDVMQVRWGTHGDHEIIALAPSSVQETMNLTIESFNLAEKFRNPVFLMLDEIVGHMREKVVIPDSIEIVNRKKPSTPREEYIPFAGEVPEFASFGTGYATYVTGLTHREDGLPSTDDPEDHSNLVTRLCRKIANNRKGITWVEQKFMEDAEIVVLSYGSTARSAFTAVEQARKEGIKAGYLRLITLWPFPREILASLDCKEIVVAEQNLGQMEHPVREFSSCKVTLCQKIGGEMHRPEEILSFVKKGVKK
jgi:2-oxoglutarate ferredoxin oxidoreductase subunit alpha